MLTHLHSRTQLALNHRKGQVAMLHSQLTQYSSLVLFCSEEAIAAESFVASLKTGVTQTEQEQGEKAEKHWREMRMSEEVLQMSTSTMKRKWQDNQEQNSLHLKCLSSIRSLRKRLNQQQLSHHQLFLQKSLQELLHARIQRAMNNLVGTFGSSDPSVVIEKLEKETSQGDTLQRNINFLIIHVAGLRRNLVILKRKREQLAQTGGSGKEGMWGDNASSMLLLHTQLHSQEQKLHYLSVLVSNAHSSLLHQLSRFTSKDRLHILSAGLTVYQQNSLEMTLLIFGKSVSMAWEWTVQRRAIWGQKQKTAFANKLVMGNVLNKRPSLIIRETVRDSLQGSKTLPILPPLSITSDLSDEMEDLRKRQYDCKQRKTGIPQKHIPASAVQTERRKYSQDKLHFFAKELRFVNTTRQHLSSISRAPKFSPRFSDQGFRASC